MSRPPGGWPAGAPPAKRARAGPGGEGALRPGALLGGRAPEDVSKQLMGISSLQGLTEPADLFGGGGRDAYMQAHVHRRLQGQAGALSDKELLELGRLSFHEQFHALEARPARQQGPDLFQGLGREGFLAARVHRRLHARAAQLSDQELHDLGQLSFNQQFPSLEGPGPTRPVPAEPLQGTRPVQPAPADLFQGLGREGYMQQRVHRKLHAVAALLSDQELLELGRLSFNDQFPVFEKAEVVTAPAAGHSKAASSFGGLSRDAYMAARVHRRLHAQAAQLSDRQLSDLGQLSFNQQFTFLENWTAVQAPKPDVFQGMSRETYMQQRVHRRLHAKAAALSDEELLELGRLSFNDQFPALEQQPEPAAAATTAQRGPAGAFGGLSREAFMAQRVHRRLHAQAAGLSDARLLELGGLSFNQQFPFLEGPAEAEAAEAEAAPAELFAGLGREGYMQARVHRRLHGKAGHLADRELFELGRLSFNEQFPVLENVEAWALIESPEPPLV